MHNNENWQEVTRQLFAGIAPPTATPDPEAPTAGPIIPGQEKAPNLSQGLTPEQRTVNRIFNAGTIREHF